VSIPEPLSKKPRDELSVTFRSVLRYAENYLRSRLSDYDNRLFGKYCDTLIDPEPVFMEHVNSRNYKGCIPTLMLKVTCSNPRLIRKIRLMFQSLDGGSIPGFGADAMENHGRWISSVFQKEHGLPDKFTILEAHVDYTIRYCADQGLGTASAWFIFNKHRIHDIPPHNRTSHSNLELVTSMYNIKQITNEYAQKLKPKFLVCTIDDEMRSGIHFPQPETDGVVSSVLRFRFGPIGEVDPRDNTSLIDTPMPDDVTVREKPCTAAIALCLGYVPSSPDYTAVCFSNEEDLLLCFHEIMAKISPDVLMGYVINNFDTPYKFRRAFHLKIYCFPYCCRYFEDPLRVSAFSVKRTGGGKNVPQEYKIEISSASRHEKKGMKWWTCDWPGMVNLDLYYYVVVFLFAKVATLNAMVKKYVSKDESKLDVPYALIGKFCESVKGRKIILDYCNKDVLLTELLDHKAMIFAFLRELATMCSVPIQALLDRASMYRILGYWIKITQRCYSQVARRVPLSMQGNLGNAPERQPLPVPDGLLDTPLGDWPKDMREDSRRNPAVDLTRDSEKIWFLTPTSNPFEPKGQDKEKYEGATVITPSKGYSVNPLTTQDYRSLYPSVMVAFNLCLSTIIQPGMQEIMADVYKMDVKKDMFHIPYFLLTYDGKTTRPYIDMKRKPSFVYQHVAKGIVCMIESQLLEQRGISKTTRDGYLTQMDKASDPVTKAALKVVAGIWDLRQLAEKIICNSIYGTLGMPGGNLGMQILAEVITCLSRQALENARYEHLRHVRKGNVILRGEDIKNTVKRIHGVIDGLRSTWDARKINAAKVQTNKLLKLDLTRCSSSDVDVVLEGVYDMFSRDAVDVADCLIAEAKDCVYRWSINVAVTYGDTDSIMSMALDYDGNDTSGDNKRKYDFDGKTVDSIRHYEGIDSDEDCDGDDDGFTDVIEGKEESNDCRQRLPLATMKDETKQHIFDEYQRFVDIFNRDMPDPMFLTREKMSFGFHSQARKKYAMFMTEKPGKPFKLKIMGNSCVRRSGCGLTKKMCARFLRTLMLTQDPQKAIEVIVKTAERVRSGKVKQIDLIFRAGLSKPIDQYKGSLPPHVAMAKKIKETGGEEMNPGDKVYYIIVPGPPDSKVRDKVQSPEDALKRGEEYDRRYYLGVVLKEAYNLICCLVDERSFAERVEAADEARMMLGKPGGKKKVEKLEADRTKLLKKIVDGIVLHGGQMDFSKRIKPSWYDLPERIREPLPPIPWHWAGYGSDQNIPHVSEYQPPWFSGKCKEEDLSRLLNEDDMNVRDVVKRNCTEDDVGDDGDVDSIDDMTVLGKNNTRKKNTGNFATATDKNGGGGSGDSSEPIEFYRVFKQQKKSKLTYSKERKTVVKPKVRNSSMFASYLVQQEKCNTCGTLITKDRFGTCDSCADDDEDSNCTRSEKETKELEDIEDLCKRIKQKEGVCRACMGNKGSVDPNGDEAMELVRTCPDQLTCDKWAPIRKLWEKRDGLKKSHAHLNEMEVDQIILDYDEDYKSYV
jgi:DNA polymerase elongation subunit (family B)